MANTKLISVLSLDKLYQIGFVYKPDGSGSPWGNSWVFANEKFEIWLDCSFDVTLERTDEPTDAIKIIVEDVFELEQLVEWVQDSKQMCMVCKNTEFDYHGNCKKCNHNKNHS